MNNHVDFYKTITIKRMAEYALATGFGSGYPLDLKEFKKIIGNRKKILEIGCGPGRLGKHLISEGYDYTGIDTSQRYLNYFKKSLKGLKGALKYNIKKINFLNMLEKEKFDVMLSPWTFMGHFSKNEQKIAIKKSLLMLNNTGIVLLDNPAPGTPYNSASGYQPTRFYFKDWKFFLSKLNLKKFYKVEYTTKTNRVREITVLEK